jgi:molecular chaperone GrpE
MTTRHSDEHIEENEVTIEDTDQVETEERLENKLKTLREKLKMCESEKMSALEDLQRARADFLNTKKRLEEQKQTEVARAADAFIATLLPLADSFSMAMADEAAWQEVDSSWRTGVEGIKSQLDRILKTHNVTKIEALHTHFDHDLHEAVGTKEGDEPDIVLEVVQEGYKKDATVLRPAKVIISS